jgi:hypothetical protein
MLTASRDPGSLAKRLGALLDARWAPERLREHARSFSWEAGLDSLERCLQGALS